LRPIVHQLIAAPRSSGNNHTTIKFRAALPITTVQAGREGAPGRIEKKQVLSLPH
jgi:hypothetical protein